MIPPESRVRNSPAPHSMAWLGAVSIHTRDYDVSYRTAVLTLLTTYTPLRLVVNHFDPPGSSRHAIEETHPRIEHTWIPDMKGLFWKRVLTADRLRGVSVVWLFDADVAVHPAVMPLGELVLALLSSNASALQPLVRSSGMGTDHSWLRQRPSLSSCMATTARFVEVMTPLLQADAWIHFHEHILSHIPDEALALSDFGIDVTWCAALAAAFRTRPPCLILYSSAALHSNSNSIHRFMNASTRSQERSCAGTCRYLRRHHPRFYMNYSHDTQECWAGSNQGLRPSGKPRYIDSCASAPLHRPPKP